jgi:hypothetical protein
MQKIRRPSRERATTPPCGPFGIRRRTICALPPVAATDQIWERPGMGPLLVK